MRIEAFDDRPGWVGTVILAVVGTLGAAAWLLITEPGGTEHSSIPSVGVGIALAHLVGFAWLAGKERLSSTLLVMGETRTFQVKLTFVCRRDLKYNGTFAEVKRVYLKEVDTDVGLRYSLHLELTEGRVYVLPFLASENDVVVSEARRLQLAFNFKGEPEILAEAPSYPSIRSWMSH